jgi:hypothetical protein
MNVDYKNAEQFESIARSEGFHDLDVMGNGCYADDFLQHFYLGWQASRQALEGEPVAWWDGDMSAAEDSFSFKSDRYYTIPLYTHPASAAKQAVSVPVYAIGRGGYIQHDTNTGQLEIYETEALARVNARDGDIVRAVNVNQV